MENKELQNFVRIHSTESFGTVDGPGIRFVLFLQGCMLKCKYCHNRDTWDLNAGNIININEILEKIKKCKNYIDFSKGGVTVTGGEPLLQVKFLINLFKKLKELNIHTCIDTSGMVQITDDIKELLNLTDLVLLDIKHIDDEKCKNLVGMSNKKELDFAKYLSDNNIKMWIRQVIIPGLTDDEKDLKKLKEFINTLRNVEKVELLPYHSMGKYKWERLGIEYELKDIPDCDSDKLEMAKKIIIN